MGQPEVDTFSSISLPGSPRPTEYPRLGRRPDSLEEARGDVRCGTSSGGRSLLYVIYAMAARDWVPIAISIVALGVSIRTKWQQDTRRKANVKVSFNQATYHEQFQAHIGVRGTMEQDPALRPVGVP